MTNLRPRSWSEILVSILVSLSTSNLRLTAVLPYSYWRGKFCQVSTIFWQDLGAIRLSGWIPPPPPPWICTVGRSGKNRLGFNSKWLGGGGEGGGGDCPGYLPLARQHRQNPILVSWRGHMLCCCFFTCVCICASLPSIEQKLNCYCFLPPSLIKFTNTAMALCLPPLFHKQKIKLLMP